MIGFKSILSLIIVFNFIACAKKNLSERDAKREQIRSSAENKKQELLQAAGQYSGQLISNLYAQDVLLTLEVKSIPEKSSDTVDPILIPMLTGHLKICFGSQTKGEYYTLAIEKADFDDKAKKIHLVAQHDKWKELILTLDQSDLTLSGSWNSPSSATSGSVILKKYEDINLLQAVGREIRGDYFGTLNWDEKKVYQRAKLHVTTQADQSLDKSILASVKLFSAHDESQEIMVYDLDQVEFNPFTHKISLNGQNSDIYFIGEWASSSINGHWYSKLYGQMGAMTWQQNEFPQASYGYKLIQKIQGIYYGYFKNQSDKTLLPRKAMINIVSFHDKEKTGSLGVSGNIRFFYGSYHSNEFIEFPFDHIEYNYFTRNLDAISSGASKFAIDMTIDDLSIMGTIADEAAGMLGSFEAKQGDPIDEKNDFPIKGVYQGRLQNLTTQTQLPEKFMIGIVSTLDSSKPSGLTLSSHIRFYFGSFDENEFVEGQCEAVQWNHLNANISMTCSTQEMSGFSLKGQINNGSIEGKLFHDSLGEVATFKVDHI